MSKREMAEKAITVCKRNEKLFKDLEISDFGRAYEQTKKLLYAIRLQEDYGITSMENYMVVNAEPNVYVKISDHMYIASMGEKYRRTISWSADGRQPKDEVLLVLTFPTGAYIFGDDYPVPLFKELWCEIKGYGFKYVDDVNHNVYFPLDSAAGIANEFPSILKKYYARYRAEADARRAQRLKQELEALEKKAAERVANQ